MVAHIGWRAHRREKVHVSIYGKVCCYSPNARIPTAENTSKLMNQVPTYQDGSLPWQQGALGATIVAFTTSKL